MFCTMRRAFQRVSSRRCERVQSSSGAGTSATIYASSNIVSSCALTSVLRARGDGAVLWLHVGLDSRVRRGDRLMTLSDCSVLTSPHDGAVAWVLPWRAFDSQQQRRVCTDDALMALRRSPPHNSSSSSSLPSFSSAQSADVLARAIASVSPRCGREAALFSRRPRAEDVLAVASDLRLGLLAHRAARPHMTDAERRALQLAQRGNSDFELFAAVANALLDGDLLLSTTRRAERLLNL